MYIDKKVRGVSTYYKLKAFGLFCKYVFIFLLIFAFFLIIMLDK